MAAIDIPGALAETVARGGIAHAIATLQRGLDRRDLALLRSAFHPDADVDYGFFVGPAAEFAEMMAGGEAPAPPRITMHRPSNVWIRVSGDRAISESYVFVLSPQPVPRGEEQALIGGRYLDRHERRDGAWRLSHRTYVLDWNINWPGTGTALPDYVGPFTRGAYRHEDPSASFFGSALQSANHSASGEASYSDGAHTQGATVEISADLAAQAERAFARNAIHELICAQARATDRGDDALLRSLWHPGATVDVGDFFTGSAEDYCTTINEVARTMVRMAHTVANEWIKVDGNRAVSETYVIAVSTAAGDEGERDTLSGGRYLDRFERIGGAWKFTQRTFVSDWIIEQPCSDRRDDPDSMYAALSTRGALYPDDPVYSFWKD